LVSFSSFFHLCIGFVFDSHGVQLSTRLCGNHFLPPWPIGGFRLFRRELVFDAIRPAGDLDDARMMNQSIDDGSGDRRIAEDLTPFG